MLSDFFAYGRGSIDVFVFHSVDTSVPYEKAWSTSLEKFGSTLDFIDENYKVLTVSDAIEAQARGILPRKTACLTFDDGDPTWITNVAPLLSDRKFSATFYVSTQQLSGEPIWHDRLAKIFSQISEPELNVPALGIRKLKTDGIRSRIKAFELLTRLLKYQFSAVRQTMLCELERTIGIVWSIKYCTFHCPDGARSCRSGS